MIKNKTKQTVISEKFVRKSYFGKIAGLMAKKNPETIVLKTRFGIHTFFLRFPIDVLVTDNKNKVVFLKKSVKPNRITVWNILFNNVVELPNGSLKKSKTQKGDILEFIS